ncbi:protein THEMIS2 [Tiliqua scincoides]|uniref:protein THEMIS2 n=1 Tax=Tiliqua scincoides TaxID=71010 RepID=UPI0034619BB0
MTDAVPFQQYICDLDVSSLPRVVRICSGVYFQGSIYEIFGSECCLSTGDLMKIINLQLQKVTCNNVENGHTFELPLNFKGLFQPSLEAPSGIKKPPLPPNPFVSKSKISGCQRPRLYTLQEVLQSSAMRRKRLKCPDIGSSEIKLCPVYKVEAIMHFRNDVVKIDSTLDVEVVDVTQEAGHIHFIKPLLLSEVLTMEKALPVEAELLGSPEGPAVFESNWVPHLQKGCRLQILSKASSWKILASSQRGKRGSCHFLISSTYEGHFRRCPRRFSSTSELALNLATAKKLHVVVTKDYESSEEPLFSVGDRLEVLNLKRSSNPSAMDMLVCSRDNGDEDKEEIQVPLFLEAGFVEDIRDSRKYTLREAMEQLLLPCEVKALAKDDPLGNFSSLRLEAQIEEPFLTISLSKQPSLAFEIPPKWLDMPLFFTGDPAKPLSPASISKVEELTEPFYYSLLKLLPSNLPVPPRPPKRRDSTLDKCPQSTREGVKSTTGTSKQPSFSKADSMSAEYTKTRSCRDLWSNPNQYTIDYGPSKPQVPTEGCKPSTEMPDSDDSDHDYEEVCESVQSTICKMKRASLRN